MITKQLSLHYRIAKTFKFNNKTSCLLTKTNHNMSSISQYVRKFMNRIRFEDNRAIQASQDKVTIQVLQTPKQVQEKFIGDEQFKSVVEKQRMQKIDEIIGTKTYFHQTKKYQQRLDSDHVMVIDDLSKKHPQPKRQHLNWQNTQAPEQYKVKSTRKFFKNLKNLRQYPKHNYRITSFIDEKSQQNIEFLGKQGLFTKLSLKWVDTYQKSLQNEIIDDKSYELHAYRYSQRFVYFATEYESSKLYRISRAKFTQKLIQSIKTFQEQKEQIQQVISMQQIYNELKQYFHDERVTQWLKKVENGQIGYLLSGYKTNQNQDGVVVWIDLLGNKKEYVHLYKKIGSKQERNSNKDIKNKLDSKQNLEQQIQKNQKVNNRNQVTSHIPFSHPPVQFMNRLIFNCKPQASFSLQNDKIFLIQRSEQGNYIELIYVPIQANHTLGRPQIVYKCKLSEQMDLIQDDGLGYLFLRVKDSNNQVGKIYAIEETLGDEGEIQLVPIDTTDLIYIQSNEQQTLKQQKHNEQKDKQPQNNSSTIKPIKLTLSSCPQGLIFTNFYPTSEYFKHGPNSQYSTKIHLIPFKSHIQLLQESTNKISSQNLLQGQVKANIRKRPSVKQLDYGNKKVLFECPQQQFITQISVRESHLIISLSTLSIYNKKRLLFLPYDESKNPHSLIFPAQSLHFLNTGYNYTSQVLSFSINRSSLLNQHYQYTIWKKQLKQMVKDEMYLETVKINENVELKVMCLNKYLQHLPKFYRQNNQQEDEQQDDDQNDNYKLQNTKVPILIYLTDNKTNNKDNNSQSTIQQTHLRQFLQKGTLIITVSCRGTLTSDLLTFYQGSGQNFNNYLEDIESTIQWIGNNLGTNISLYSKGYISSLVGMLINVKYPFLLTSTVLHNGLYQLINDKKTPLINQQQIQYFIRFNQHQQLQQKQKQQKTIKFWQHYNPASFFFKRSKIATKKVIEQQPKPKVQRQQSNNNNEEQQSQQQYQTKAIPKIGTLQNVVISCQNNDLSKDQARRMIYHLRKNPHFRYQQVFLKQFMQGEDKQLFNLAFIYGKMKERLQQQNMK